MKLPESSSADVRRFWAVVDSHRKLDGEEQVNAILSDLREMSTDELIRFDMVFTECYNRLNTHDVWGALYLAVPGGCGNDTFMDARSWLIFQGESVYTKALVDPDGLCDFFLKKRPCRIMSGYCSMVEVVIEERYAGEYEIPCTVDGSPMRGEEWDLHDLEARFPKLWASFGDEVELEDLSQPSRSDPRSQNGLPATSGSSPRSTGSGEEASGSSDMPDYFEDLFK